MPPYRGMATIFGPKLFSLHSFLTFYISEPPPTHGGCHDFKGDLLRLYFTLTRTCVIIYTYVSSRLTGVTYNLTCFIPILLSLHSFSFTHPHGGTMPPTYAMLNPPIPLISIFHPLHSLTRVNPNGALGVGGARRNSFPSLPSINPYSHLAVTTVVQLHPSSRTLNTYYNLALTTSTHKGQS